MSKEAAVRVVALLLFATHLAHPAVSQWYHSISLISPYLMFVFFFAGCLGAAGADGAAVVAAAVAVAVIAAATVVAAADLSSGQHCVSVCCRLYSSSCCCYHTTTAADRRGLRSATCSVV
jgi:hypothetical protein